jgi:hypothetical protein
MLSLQELQNQTARSLLGGDTTTIAGEFAVAQASARRRLSIYRNNTIASLTAALTATFPVTVRLADERFFAYAAHSFITAEPPRETRLSAYGEGFPRFLARFPAARGTPVLAQMATLEWAIAAALNADEEEPAPIALLAELERGGGCLRLQPNLRFVATRSNLVDVWMDHKAPAGHALRPLARRATRIAVTRRGEDIQFVDLEPARFAFWRSLAKGTTVAQAMTRALARDPLFDLVAETLLLFRAGLVTGLEVPPSTH